MKEVETSQEVTPLKGLRLAARIAGTLWVLFCLLFLIGYLMEGIHKNGGHFAIPGDWMGAATEIFIFIGLGGLILAYWQEGKGGFISLIAFILAGLFLILDPELKFSFIFMFIFIPTILYLGYWWNIRKL
jgi:hypothetical protein